MRNFFDWINEETDVVNDAWLVLGKGPSYSKINQFDIEDFYTVSLNHVVADRPVDLAHIIDIEVVEQCAAKITENAKYLVLPWVPHVRKADGNGNITFEPGNLDLDEFCNKLPVLSDLRKQNRLLWYNLFTASPNRVCDGSPLIYAKDFSASAVLNLLAEAGIKKVRSLGIDGGRGYSKSFKQLENTTMLQTGQSSYDSQFKGIANTVWNKKLDFAPLDLESPITVFVGTQPEQELALKVLEHSILRNASMNVEVIPLYKAIEKAGIEIPVPKDPDLRPRTPFSFQRFAIPQLKGYRGRAIYVDSDMQVFQDIRKLWIWPFDNADLLTVEEPAASGRRPQFSVMVLDCERLQWDIKDLINNLEKGRWSYSEFMYEMAPAERVSTVLPSVWNDLERHNDLSALTHYTDMNEQPWLSTTNTIAHIWCEELFAALESGFITRKYVEKQVETGWVRPSLLFQIDNNIIDPLLLPINTVRNDLRTFVPPHVKMFKSQNHNISNTWKMRAKRGYAIARNFLKITGADHIYRRVRRRMLRVKHT